MKTVTLTLAAGFALAFNSPEAAQKQVADRGTLERNVASAILATPGLFVKLVNEPEHPVVSAETSGCHTRFRAGGAWYDFDWSTPTAAPVRSQATRLSGFVNGRLATIMLPDGGGDSDRRRFDTLFRALNAYWEHCNPGAATEQDW